MLPMLPAASRVNWFVMILASRDALTMLPFSLVRKVRPSVFFRTPLIRMVWPESTSSRPASLALKLMPIRLSALAVLVTTSVPVRGARWYQLVRHVPPSSNSLLPGKP